MHISMCHLHWDRNLKERKWETKYTYSHTQYTQKTYTHTEIAVTLLRWCYGKFVWHIHIRVTATASSVYQQKKWFFNLKFLLAHCSGIEIALWILHHFKTLVKCKTWIKLNRRVVFLFRFLSLFRSLFLSFPLSMSFSLSLSHFSLSFTRIHGCAHFFHHRHFTTATHTDDGNKQSIWCLNTNHYFTWRLQLKLIVNHLLDGPKHAYDKLPGLHWTDFFLSFSPLVIIGISSFPAVALILFSTPVILVFISGRVFSREKKHNQK